MLTILFQQKRYSLNELRRVADGVIKKYSQSLVEVVIELLVLERLMFAGVQETKITVSNYVN